MQERIQKIMARAGLGSRRENEKIIASGRVRLNGRLAKLGDKADPQKDIVEVDGKKITPLEENFIYIILNKPRGVISSLEDDLNQKRKTVRDLISIPGHIYPVGRLDKQSTGLILMTNDGQLAHKLTHPRYEHEKIYEVELEGNIDDQSLQAWRRGVMLDERKTIPAKIELVQRTKTFTRLRITLREGRKRQIRRIAAGFGYPVRHLLRTAIGPVSLGELKTGQWRHLSKKEINLLRAVTKKKVNRSKQSKK